MSSPSTPSPTAHYLTRSHPRQREGRLPRPLLCDVIATPRHHISSNQQRQGSASTVCHPARLVLVLVLFLQVVRKGIANERTEQEERTRAKDAAAIFASSSTLFCSVCCLHRPHHRQPLTTSPPSHQQPARDDGRQPRPVLGDVIATTSPHLAADRPTTSSRAAPRRSDILPASSSSPSHPSGGEEWKRKGANRTGRERTRAKDAADIFARSSLLSVAITVHAIARSSLPSSSAVPVILRPDLVRLLSSVRPSVFLFLVPRSPSFRLTAKSTPAAHYLTS